MAESQTNQNTVKILSVVWYKVLPAQYGGQKAVAVFNEHLGQLATLTCLCSANNLQQQSSYTIVAELPSSKSQFVNPFTWLKIYRLAKQSRATHIILEFPYHGIAGFICKKLLPVKLITNTHNIEYLRFKQLKKWWWPLLYKFEKWTLQRSSLVFFKTADDQQKALALFNLQKNKTAVIPFGVEEPGTSIEAGTKQQLQLKHGLLTGEKILLFAGTLDYLPNADAVSNIVEKLIPLLNKTDLKYKIIVCGRNEKSQFAYLNKLKNVQIIVAGEVPNIEEYFAAADIFINPVQMGGGVQTKIMEALRFNLNVVCFKKQSSGIEKAVNKLFVSADDNWTDFAAQIMRAVTIKEQTPAEFFIRYNWNKITSDAIKLLHP